MNKVEVVFGLVFILLALSGVVVAEDDLVSHWDFDWQLTSNRATSHVSNGQLQIDIPSGVGGGYFYLKNSERLHKDFDVSFDFDNFYRHGNIDGFVDLLIDFDGKYPVRLYRGRDCNLPEVADPSGVPPVTDQNNCNGDFIIVFNPSGTGPRYQAYYENNAGSSGNLRIVRQGNVLKYYFDGNEIYSRTYSLLPDYADVQVRVGTTSVDFSVNIDNFNMKSESCIESWTCNDWSSCSDGQQVRSCSDSSSCGTQDDKPSESQSCVEESILECIDSDGGLDYYVKGSATGKFGDYSGVTTLEDTCCSVWLNEFGQPAGCENVQDSSVISSNINEAFCDNGRTSWTSYACPNSCENGACIEDIYFNESYLEEGNCFGLMKMIKNPVNIEIDGTRWESRWNNNYSYSYYGPEGERIDVESYYADFNYDGNNRYGYASISINELGVGGEDLAQEFLDNSLSYDLCVLDDFNMDGEDQNVYVCKNAWDNAYRSRNIDNDNSWRSARVFWINDNNLFEMSFSESNYDYWTCYDEQCYKDRENYQHQEGQRNVVDFLEKMIDNRAEYVGVSVWNLNWESMRFLNYFLGRCSSDLEMSEEEGGFSSWQCITEPAICPAHGRQVQTCSSRNYKTDEERIRTAELSCNPGICDGCYIPKWFEQGSLGDKQCIPYGFRFEQQTGWDIDEVFYEDVDVEGLSVGEANKWDDVDLVVYKNGTALLSMKDESNISLFLEEGETYDWNEITGDSSGFDYTLTVDDIVYDIVNYENSYIEVVFRMSGWEKEMTIETVNAYCDMDGRIKEQRGVSWDGAWANCQNNYECESNLCSSGECIEITQMISNVASYKVWGIKIICKLGHLLNVDNYDSCVAERLGEDYLEEEPQSSGGSGGGSSVA